MPSSLRAGPDTPPGLVPKRFMLGRVEEVYIHCAKHIPAMRKVGKQIHWGTDDDEFKGGDAFGVRDAERHWLASEPGEE